MTNLRSLHVPLEDRDILRMKPSNRAISCHLLNGSREPKWSLTDSDVLQLQLDGDDLRLGGRSFGPRMTASDELHVELTDSDVLQLTLPDDDVLRLGLTKNTALHLNLTDSDVLQLSWPHRSEF